MGSTRGQFHGTSFKGEARPVPPFYLLEPAKVALCCSFQWAFHQSFFDQLVIWVGLKIKQQGQTAGFGTHVSAYQGKPFGIPVFGATAIWMDIRRPLASFCPSPLPRKEAGSLATVLQKSDLTETWWLPIRFELCCFLVLVVVFEFSPLKVENF